MRRESIVVTAEAARFDPKSGPSWDFTFAAYKSAMELYRHMARFIRRHVISRSDARIRRLRGLNSSSKVGEAMARDEADRTAWAYMMWCRRLEPDAHVRLWRGPKARELFRRHNPYRPDIELGRHALDYELKVDLAEQQLNISQSDWMLRHASAAALRYIWAQALDLARGMAQAGVGGWGPGMLEERTDVLVTGSLGPSGAVDLVVEGPAVVAPLQPRGTRPKEARAAEYAKLQESRRAEIREICAGPCLRFTYESGWQVVDAANTPTSVDVRRRRLFAAGRPAFFLFETLDGGYCARLCERRLEVLDSAPWRAIATLHQAVLRYERMYGSVSKTIDRSPLPALQPSVRTGSRRAHPTYRYVNDD
jgi:hypothetical protein